MRWLLVREAPHYIEYAPTFTDAEHYIWHRSCDAELSNNFWAFCEPSWKQTISVNQKEISGLGGKIKSWLCLFVFLRGGSLSPSELISSVSSVHQLKSHHWKTTVTKEYFDIWGNTIICFLAESWIRRRVPLSHLSVKYETRASLA